MSKNPIFFASSRNRSRRGDSESERASTSPRVCVYVCACVCVAVIIVCVELECFIDPFGKGRFFALHSSSELSSRKSAKED